MHLIQTNQVYYSILGKRLMTYMLSWPGMRGKMYIRDSERGDQYSKKFYNRYLPLYQFKKWPKLS